MNRRQLVAILIPAFALSISHSLFIVTVAVFDKIFSRFGYYANPLMLGPIITLLLLSVAIIWLAFLFDKKSKWYIWGNLPIVKVKSEHEKIDQGRMYRFPQGSVTVSDKPDGKHYNAFAVTEKELLSVIEQEKT